MSGGRVLIAGLGIAGPTLAYWLQRYGFSPTLVELAPAPRRGGYMIDFWGVGYDVAERMGLLPELHAAGYRIQEVRFVNARNEPIAGIAGEAFRAALGDRFLSILRGDLAFAIFRQIQRTVPVRYGDQVAGIAQDAGGVEVALASGGRERFDLLVGADGLHSAVRRLAFAAEGDGEKPLGYWVATFTTRGYPHRAEDVYTSYTDPGRQLARYALRDGRTAFVFIWADRGEPAPPPHDPAAQAGAVRRAFAGAAWEWPEIEPRLAAADDLYFDAVSQVRIPAWSTGRVALVGDAAFSPSLVAGQGAALAMAGAYLLAGELATHAGDHRAALMRYEQRFRPFIERKQDGAIGFADQFAPRTRWALWLRNLSVNLLKVPVLGPRLMRTMIGDAFELPDYRCDER